MAEDALEIEIDLAELFSSPPPPEPKGDGAGAAVELPPRFDVVAAGIKTDRVRHLVTDIFAGQLKAIDTLEVIESALAESGMAKAVRLFDGLRNQCASLLSYITDAVAAADYLDEELRDTLDCLRFIIAHEMGKVFGPNFPRPAGEAGAQYSRAESTRSWGLMQNCLQQTAITLAQTFDPAVGGEMLFEDYRSKVEHSHTLYRELNRLLQKVHRAEEANGILLKHSFVRHLELFRDEHMHFLMYKDWAEFENFVGKVLRAFEEMESLTDVLHEFARYLETLIHHVGMREVLKNVTARPVGGIVPETEQLVLGTRPGPERRGLSVG
jgi:hypothetical protein